MKPIRVVIVEDSAVVREYLSYVIGLDPGLTVAGTAVNGEDAVEVVGRVKPDVVTMDIHMPRMDGFEATRRIMESCPTRIIVVSGSSDARDVAFSFRAVEAGALTVIGCPTGIDGPDSERIAQDLRRTIRLMSEIRVVRRWPAATTAAAAAAATTAAAPRTTAAASAASQAAAAPALTKAGAPTTPAAPISTTPPMAAGIQAVAIGASTGGPIALRAVLSGFTKGFPAPILIVQHVVPGFIAGLAQWLGEASEIPVCVASEGEKPLPGRAYLAPDGAHMTVDAGGVVRLVPRARGELICPSAGALFRSVAEAYGPRCAGVLLSGMGGDGAREMRLLRDRKAVTIAQDRETSLIFGMPGEAVRLGAAGYVLPVERIAPTLQSLAGAAQ